MFISKKQNGYFYIVYENRNVKRTSLTTKTKIKSEAKQFLTSFRKQYIEEISNPIIPISLTKFMMNYLRYSESVHTWKTTKANQTTFRFLIAHFGDITIDRITTKDMSDFILNRMKGSIFAARRDHINSSAMFNKAVLDGHILKNPCVGIKRLKLPEKQPTFYTKETLQQLLNAIDDEDVKDIVQFDVNTGLRQAEICTLQWSQVNELKKLITLDNRGHITKSKRIRSIPLNNEAMEIINKRKLKRINEFVFTWRNTTIHIDRFCKTFKKYIRAAELDDKLNFHSLRHTFASWLVQRGISIFIVSKLLGHQDVKTTMIYSHLTTDELRTATDILNNSIEEF